MIHAPIAGGIGDLIVSVNWIQSHLSMCEKWIFYTPFTDILKHFNPYLIIKDISQFDPNCDISVEISDLFRFKIKHPKLIENTKFGSFYNIVKEVYDRENWHEIILKHPQFANEMGHKFVELGVKRYQTLFHFMKEESVRMVGVLPSADTPDRFITVHDGFDSTGFYKFDTSMKNWSMDSWNRFTTMFKLQYPDIAIVQLGGVKHHKIPGVDLNLAGQLPFEETLKYLQSSLCHIDGDSGLVHARAMYRNPSVVIFGPTNPLYFGYPENENISPLFCGDCWWQKKDWMQNCVKGYGTNICMQDIPASTVMKRIERIFHVAGIH